MSTLRCKSAGKEKLVGKVEKMIGTWSFEFESDEVTFRRGSDAKAKDGTRGIVNARTKPTLERIVSPERTQRSGEDLHATYNESNDHNLFSGTPLST